MDEEFSQFRQRQREEEAVRAEQGQRAVSAEFESVEEALRVDRERTVVPAHLAERVSEAVQREAARSPSWWTRWFRRG